MSLLCAVMVGGASFLVAGCDSGSPPEGKTVVPAVNPLEQSSAAKKVMEQKGASKSKVEMPK